jgi:hypothetical protein
MLVKKYGTSQNTKCLVSLGAIGEPCYLVKYEKHKGENFLQILCLQRPCRKCSPMDLHGLHCQK